MDNLQDTNNTHSLDRFLVTFQKGEIIFFEHDLEDDAYMIKQGKVRLIKIIDGVEKYLAIITEGDFLGEVSLLTNNPRSATAIAVEETQAYKISKANFNLLVDSNTTIALKILTLTAERIEKQRRQLQILLLNDDETQILDAILMLYEKLNISTTENVSVHTTPYEITTWAGVTKDKARQILTNYQESKKISVFPDSIVIHNTNELERIVLTRRKALLLKEDSSS